MHSFAQSCTVHAQSCTVMHSSAQLCTVLHSSAQLCTVCCYAVVPAWLLTVFKSHDVKWLMSGGSLVIWPCDHSCDLVTWPLLPRVLMVNHFNYVHRSLTPSFIRKQTLCVTTPTCSSTWPRTTLVGTGERLNTLHPLGWSKVSPPLQFSSLPTWPSPSASKPTALTLQQMLSSSRCLWKMKSDTWLPSSPSPCPLSSRTMRSMTRKCWQSSKLSKSGGTSSKAQSTNARSGWITKTWSTS